MLVIKLYPLPPYDFDRMIRRVVGVGHEMYRVEEGRLIRTIRVQGKVYWIAIQSTGTVQEPKLEVEVHAQDGDIEQAAVEAHLQRMLSTKQDLTEFKHHLETQTDMGSLATTFEGLHIILESDLFECMAKTIIGQQLNLSFAATLNKRLIELASTPFEKDGQIYPVFPSADEVAALTYEQLRELQFSQRKAEYTIDFARAVSEGRLDLQSLYEQDNETIVNDLIKLRGIGRWTVECFLLFGLGRTDLLPAADIGLRNALKRWYGMDHQPTEPEVREIGKNWNPWSSYVTFYLWETLNTAK